VTLTDLISDMKECAPKLWAELHDLCGHWLEEPLRHSRQPRTSYRIKHLNDPIWGTIELMPWEMTLLDSELVQRLRGVKQLGLAHLVFPGATHDRFSHLCGVVAAVDLMIASIRRNDGHRRLGAASGVPASAPLSDYTVDDNDRYITRLAALVHDVGHGPFSHAVEPLISIRYRAEIDGLQNVLARSFQGVNQVSVSEIISVLIVLSESFQQFLQGTIVRFGTRSPEEITKRIVASIVGGFDGSPGECLALLVSSQIDADKLDYMARDAYHAGLPIDFDSERLISKLEIAVVSRNTVAPRLNDLARRADAHSQQRYNDVAIAAAGVGAFEQMLVGRTFLYDRLYHHHKVRAADAMAQRLVHYADEARNLRVSDLFLSLPDEAMIRALGGLITAGLPLTPNPKAKALATALVSRGLYKRAFAFAGRFLAGLEFDPSPGEDASDPSSPDVVEPTMSEQEKDAERARVLHQINKRLPDLLSRIEVERTIAALAKKLGQAFPDGHPLRKQAETVEDYHIIVDLPRSPVPARIQVIAMMEDGRIEIPDVFYDPARWSAVYDLQRRTGYVFCEPAYLALIALASRIWFLREFQAVLSPLADRFSKTVGTLAPTVYQTLVEAALIDSKERDLLVHPRLFRAPIREEEIRLPASWQTIKPTFARDFVTIFNAVLAEGLPAQTLSKLRQGLRGVFDFMQTMSEDATFSTRSLASEAELQRLFVRALRMLRLDLTEGVDRAGGETDVVVGHRLLIEIKLAAEPTDGPFELAPKYALQGRRYIIPTAERFFVTLLAYTPVTERGYFRPADAVLVRQVPGVDDPCVEIRCVIAAGGSTPSRAKVPPAVQAS